MKDAGHKADQFNNTTWELQHKIQAIQKAKNGSFPIWIIKRSAQRKGVKFPACVRKIYFHLAPQLVAIIKFSLYFLCPHNVPLLMQQNI